VVAAATVVWLYALLGTFLGLGMFVAALARYPYRNPDMAAGLVITVLSWGNIVLGVLLVLGFGWARITVSVLAAVWFVVEILAVFSMADPMPLPGLAILMLAVLNLVLLVLLNNSRAAAYFAAKRQRRVDSRSSTAA
jgi:hypothetical protein